ncbi:MAG TPA: DNA polymerase III subunit gamma/tau [Chloroflexi bacterium]|jgi:DNA polymerase-3 subunit gamma/tau|nr:DNA polymerase III subunit gamma/tau [Chloroflexota bacterium]
MRRAPSHIDAHDISCTPTTDYPDRVPERAALYRRYRSQTFAEVIGQEHVTRTLKNAIANGQVAHAYLLAGARGIGKTSIARIIAKAVNCPKAKNGDPCDACESCVAIREGRYLDLIEIDAASNRGIDEMRDLREKVRFAPSMGQYKVYVIDEAHQLTNEAFNALLKTLEEPPAHVIFVLATTESQRIPATIVSRTQRFDLRRIPHQKMVQQLATIAMTEKWQVEPAALEAISRHAQGSLRDAESILDQVATFAEGKVRVDDVDELLGATDWEETSALYDAIAANDAAKAVGLVRTLVDDGRDLRLFVRRAMDHMRALVLVRASDMLPETATESVAAVLRRQAPLFSLDRLAKIAHRLIETEQQLRTGEGTPLPLELALLDLTTEGAAPAPAPKQPAPQGTTAKSAPHGTVPSRTASPAPATAPRSDAVVDLAERRAQQTATAAAPGAARPIGAASPGVTLQRVRSAWDQLLERVQERSIAKAAQLVKAEPVAIEGGTIVLAFSDEFARQMWDRQRPELERDLGELVGTAMRVRCVKQPAAAATNTQPATEDPMLRAALETFRRPDRILEVE